MHRAILVSSALDFATTNRSAGRRYFLNGLRCVAPPLPLSLRERGWGEGIPCAVFLLPHPTLSLRERGIKFRRRVSGVPNTRRDRFAARVIGAQQLPYV